ncbi:MAG: heme exporter protein CcmB [Candidatus Eisenbacteria bacterium]|nr:heme exporter protein CcmB [Candidatus Eisenbacteria bacterium]
MGAAAQAAAILRKDLLVEFRNRQALGTMILFALLVVLVLAFAFEPTAEESRRIGPGILWIAFAFAGTIGLEHTSSSERTLGGMEALLASPLDRGTLYLAKLLANTIFLFLAECAVLPFFVVFFDVNLLPFLWKLLALALAGTVGFCAAGTLLSAVTAGTRLRGVLLPVLLFPVVVPVLVAAVEGTAALFDGRSAAGSFRILIAFDAIFTAAAALLFGAALEEGG